MFTSYHIDKIDDKNLVIIDVQKGTACPYYLKNKGIRPIGVYVRQGASSVPAISAAILNDGDSYEAILDVSQASAARILKKMVDREELFKIGNEKKLRYVKK